MPLKHHNSQKRIQEPGKIYYTVSKTHQNFPYFKESIFCELLVEELRLCKKLKQFKLLAFSIMYDHLNLLVQTSKECNVSNIMQYAKRHASRNINYFLGYNSEPVNYIDSRRDTFCLEGDNGHCRLQGKTYPYEAIDEFISTLKNLKTQFIHKYRNFNLNKIPKFKWQKSFHDHIIRNKKDYYAHYNYTVYNHLKHKLPKDWKYTSMNYIGDREFMDVAWW